MQIAGVYSIDPGPGKDCQGGNFTSFDTFLTEAIHAYVQKHGTKAAKAKAREVLARYRPDFPGREQIMREKEQA